MKKISSLKLSRLDADLWAIEDVMSSENSIAYLLRGKSKALLFDTGPGLGPVLPIVREITGLPIVVCLSHWHFDHTGGAHEFDTIVGWNSAHMQDASKHGVSADVIGSQVDNIFWESIGTDNFQTKKFPNVRMINREQSINIGGYKLKILHTPGHTKDSICLYEPDKQWLFTGDTAYPGPVYLHFEDSEPEQYGKTLERLLRHEVSAVFPGHNTTKTSGEVLVEIYKLLHDDFYISHAYPNLSINQGPEP